MRTLVVFLTLQAIFLSSPLTATPSENQETSTLSTAPNLPAASTSGIVQGRLLGPDGTPAVGVIVSLPDVPLTAETDDRGLFLFPTVPPGTHRLTATGTGFPSLRMSGLLDAAKRTLALET